MSCENRTGTPCNEFMCGASVNGMCTVDMPKRRYIDCASTYDNAIDDMTTLLLNNEVIDKSVVRRIAAQLKGCK